MFKRIWALAVIFSVVFGSIMPLPQAYAENVLNLPQPGTMVALSPAYQPVIIKGLTVNKDNPFLFDFIVDISQDRLQGDALKKEGEKLIKYFLAGLAIPEEDVWVNLSPYEKDRIIPKVLGQTEMGRDLLAQDYLLKQITASLIYPEKELGKDFWDKVYAKAQQMYGTTQVPINTFNKVWIMADRAEVFENNQTAFVVDSHLKVMLEEDYLALKKNKTSSMSLASTTENKTHSVSSHIIRQIILPELEKEVNQGKNFANLRQIFNSLILAGWYKNNVKQAVLNQVYTAKDKVKGIEVQDKTIAEQIYQRYLLAYKKGVFNFIKEDSSAGTTVPRKYFSGGVMTAGLARNPKVTQDRNRVNQAMSSEDESRLATLQTVLDLGMSSGNPDLALASYPDVRTTIQNALKATGYQLPYGSSDGPEGLAQKLAGHIHRQLGINLPPEQVVVAPTVKEIMTMLGRVLPNEDKKILTLNSTDLDVKDIKDSKALRWRIAKSKPSMIHLTPGQWDRNVVYDLWQYAVANKILLFIEESSQKISSDDLIEKAIARGDSGGEFVLRYLSLASVNPVVARTRFGVLFSHNEQLLTSIKYYNRNLGYMGLDTLALAYLFVSLPDGEKFSGQPIVQNSLDFFSNPAAGYFKLGAIYTNGARFLKEKALKNHIGATSYPAPDFLIEGFIRALEATDSRDIWESYAIENIVHYLKETRNLVYKNNNVHLGMGVKPLIGDTLIAIATKARDEGKKVRVFVPTPYWPSYREMGELAGVEMIEVKEQDLTEYLEAQPQQANIQDVLIVNDPNNPMGKIYDEERLKRLAKWVEDRNAYVISDEIYSQLIMPTAKSKSQSLASLGPKLLDRTIVLGGISKIFAAAGLRLGFAVFGPNSGLEPYFQSSTEPTIGALGGATAVYSKPNRALEYAQRHAQFVYDLSVEITTILDEYGIPYPPMEASIYVFPDFSTLFERNLKWDGETITADNFFGPDGIFYRATGIGAVFFDKQVPGTLRFAVAHQDIREAARRLKEFFIAIGLPSRSEANPAQTSNSIQPVPAIHGGIDLNTNDMNWKINMNGKGIQMNVDPAMIERIKREGIDSLTPVIFKITPIQSIGTIIAS